MADNKYGKLYTRDDVLAIIEICIEAGVDNSTDAWKHIDGYKGKLSNNMPVFVLLGQDRRALGTVRYYRDHQGSDAPNEHIRMIEKSLDDFDQYRIDNPHKMKMPD